MANRHTTRRSDGLSTTLTSVKCASKYSAEKPVSMMALLESTTNACSEPVVFGMNCKDAEKLRLAMAKVRKDTPKAFIHILSFDQDFGFFGGNARGISPSSKPSAFAAGTLPAPPFKMGGRRETGIVTVATGSTLLSIAPPRP